MKVLTGFLFGVVAVVIASVIYVYSGMFNIAAVEPHGPVEVWAYTLAREKSVKVRTKDITPPPMPPRGLNPPAPKVNEVAQDWRRAELFWIVKNGIKMTGIPAFGPAHSDEELWLVVAFSRRLPNITPDEYREMA